MKTADKVIGVIILILLTTCIALFVWNTKIRKENATLQAAINKPAVEQKPKIVYKETIRLVPKEVLKDMTEEQRQLWAKQVQDLENQLYAVRVTEISIDEGSTTKPNVPILKPVDPNSGKNKKSFIEGLGYSGAAEIAVGYQPLSKLDLYGVVGYNTQSKIGAGLLYRF